MATTNNILLKGAKGKIGKNLIIKNYGEKTVLNNISLDVYPGQIIGYIGPNGAGKSTTVKILTGVIQDYDGEVNVNGRNLRENVL